jgi:hypothetical protein
MLLHSMLDELITGDLDELITGDVDVFAELLQQFIINIMSSFDLPENQSERNYHLFVLVMLVALENTYTVKSNRESGYGRYDVMLIPTDKNKPGIIIEFKRVFKQTIKQAPVAALKQIHEKAYVQELRAQSIKEIIAYGIAFKGKKVLVHCEHL